MDDLGTTSLSTADRSLAWFGIVAGVIPFFVNYSESSSVSVNGQVTASHFRDWVAIGGGGTALVVGGIAVALAVRNKAGSARVAMAAAAIALGVLQLVRGFGVLQNKGDVATSKVAISETAAPPPEDMTPGHCPVDTCNDRGVALEKSKDFAGALKEFVHGCDQGDSLGCSNAGNYLQNGDHVPKDGKRALALFTKSCEGNDKWGCASLGLKAYEGEDMAKDIHVAITAFDKSCAKKNAEACRNLGVIYRDDKEVADPTKAVEQFQKSCDLDNGAGCNSLAASYPDADAAKALPLFERACKLGEKHFGCYNLGRMLEDGAGGAKKDPARAREQFAVACDAESADGCNEIGVMLDNGIGGPKDLDKAVEYFQKACDAKSDLGCTNLKKAQKRQKKK